MKYLIIFTFLLICNACSKDLGVNKSDAFAITNCSKIDKPSNGFSKIKLTATNNSDLTLGCWAYIKIKKGNTIIETGSVNFYSLNPGESQIEEAWFSNFDKHNEYDNADVTLNWTIDSTGYSRHYSF
jgi:hypothetical protein